MSTTSKSPRKLLLPGSRLMLPLRKSWLRTRRCAPQKNIQPQIFACIGFQVHQQKAGCGRLACQCSLIDCSSFRSLPHAISSDLSLIRSVWSSCLTTFADLQWQSREFFEVASPESTQAVARYTFRNTGQKPVEIVSVSSSCGCTVAKPDKTLYQPGEAGQIEATFVFGSRTGDQRKTITVRSREDQSKPQADSFSPP